MAISKVVLNNSSRLSKGIVTTSGTKLFISRKVYQELGSLVANKKIIDAYTNNELSHEYVAILDELTKLNSGEEVDPAIEELDAFLGSLGIEAEYSYGKDTQSIPSWFEAVGQDAFRNVGKDIGVDDTAEFNIVHTIDGIAYNVVQSTGE